MTISQVRSQLEEGRARLFASIRGLSEEQFRQTPSSDDWNIATHLAHLLRTERLFAGRARLALDEDVPFLESTRVQNDSDPDLALRMAVPQIIHGMQASRRDLETVLDAAGDDGLDRALVHERLGRMTIRDIAVKMAAHETEHAELVAEVARQATASSHVIIPLKPRS